MWELNQIMDHSMKWGSGGVTQGKFLKNVDAFWRILTKFAVRLHKKCVLFGVKSYLSNVDSAKIIGMKFICQFLSRFSRKINVFVACWQTGLITYYDYCKVVSLS